MRNNEACSSNEKNVSKHHNPPKEHSSSVSKSKDNTGFVMPEKSKRARPSSPKNTELKISNSFAALGDESPAKKKPVTVSLKKKSSMEYLNAAELPAASSSKEKISGVSCSSMDTDGFASPEKAKASSSSLDRRLSRSNLDLRAKSNFNKPSKTSQSKGKTGNSSSIKN